ncbi:transporter [Klebsiella michiganensis]|uniref:Transporter n=1 Tax=Klebsiella michiganensis TaxID=1134687 RepID=A0A7H4LUA6_9ENTR|nr:transporter [Klebsiella michiganensis]
MSTLSVDNAGAVSAPVSSVGDVARLINSGREQSKYARMIVFLALGGVFLDAYDLTTLSYGIDDVVREFQLSPLLTGIVTSSIMVGTIIGNLIGGWLTDKYGRYSVFMADMLFFVVSAIAAGLAPNVWVLIGARFLMGIGVGSISRSPCLIWPSFPALAGRVIRPRGSRPGVRCGTPPRRSVF